MRRSGARKTPVGDKNVLGVFRAPGGGTFRSTSGALELCTPRRRPRKPARPSLRLPPSRRSLRSTARARRGPARPRRARARSPPHSHVTLLPARPPRVSAFPTPRPRFALALCHPSPRPEDQEHGPRPSRTPGTVHALELNRQGRVLFPRSLKAPRGGGGLDRTPAPATTTLTHTHIAPPTPRQDLPHPQKRGHAPGHAQPPRGARRKAG